jgi:cell division septum initiation protein DivIVA
MGTMDAEDLHRKAEWLRSAEPSRALRGFDEEQTRKLLDDAAQLLKAAAREQEALQRELETVHSVAGEETAGKEAIGRALLVATQTGEDLVAEARASAEKITADAEVEAAAVLEQATAAASERERESVAARESVEAELAAARAALEQAQGEWQELLEAERKQVLEAAQVEADAIVGDARRDAEQLQGSAKRLQLLLADRQQRFVEIAQAALDQLEGLDEVVSRSDEVELLDDLRPPADGGGGEEQPEPAVEAEL